MTQPKIKQLQPMIVVLIGPPASGKSTYCTEKLKYTYDYFFRLNQDSIRSMFKGNNKLYWETYSEASEKVVGELNILMAQHLISKGQHIILDNTHCNVKVLQNIIDNFKDKAFFKFISFHQPLWKLKLRNILRYIKTFGQVWIPINVIKSMQTKQKYVEDWLNKNNYKFEVYE